MLLHRGAALAFAGALTLAFASCSGNFGAKLPPKKPVLPVSGQVLVDGKPAQGIVITLRPTGANEGFYKYPTAVTDAEGHFKLGTYAKQDGAPAGSYAAVFVWPIPIDQQTTDDDKLMRLYAEPKNSKFPVTVADKPLTLDPFDLKLDGLEGIPMTKDEIKDLEINKKQHAGTKGK